LDQLPFSVIARKETFAHPNFDLQLEGFNGTFFDALSAGKTVATYTDTEKHAVTLFDIKNDTLVCKNTYNDQKVFEISIAQNCPQFGYFISFKKITTRSKENIDSLGEKNLSLINLIEMGFAEGACIEAVEQTSNFENALQILYTKRITDLLHNPPPPELKNGIVWKIRLIKLIKTIN